MYTIQQNRRFCKVVEPPKRCRKDKKPKTKMHSDRTFTDDFLRYRFTPLLMDSQLLRDSVQKENFFLQTLRNIENAFDLPFTELDTAPFPLNIRHTFHKVKALFDEHNEYEKLFLVKSGKQPYCLATAMAWDTGATLYFLPLEQLHKICRNKRYKGEAGLLLSVCSYLYQKAGIPSYTKGDTISNYYQMFGESLEQNEEEFEQLEYSQVQSELRMAEYFGKKFNRTLNYSYHVEQWQKRLDNYRPRTEKNKGFLKMVRTFFLLYKKFPKRKFYDQIFTSFWTNECDDIMEADAYVSFVWSNEGWLGNNLFDYINERGNNCDHIEEPLFFKLFDIPNGRMSNNLAFERELFSQLNELAYYLNIYCNDKP